MSLVESVSIEMHKFKTLTQSTAVGSQAQRIRTALGLSAGARIPLVNEHALSRYFQFLSTELSFPFIAHYPPPRTPREEVKFECKVLHLLDPLRYVGDHFDGIFCKTRKAGFEVNLPLVELEVSHNHPNAQLIEDYWYWFWNWQHR